MKKQLYSKLQPYKASTGKMPYPIMLFRTLALAPKGIHTEMAQSPEQRKLGE